MGDICRDSCLFGNSPAFAVLLQTVYLDDIYKAAKKNTLNNANDKVEQS